MVQSDLQFVGCSALGGPFAACVQVALGGPVKAPEDWRTPKPGGASRGPRESLILVLPVGFSAFTPQTLRIRSML